MIVDPVLVTARVVLAVAATILVPLAAPRGTSRILLPAGVALALSLLVPTGPLAAALTLPWLAASAWLALRALRRVLTRRPLEEQAIDVGLLHLPVGAAWAFAYRADLVVLGFTGTKALLTANHFHVAGLGACVVAGLLGRALPEDGARRAIWRVATGVVLAGIGTLAVGITFSRPLERAAALALSLAVAALGGLLLTLRSVLLAIAGLAALFAMFRAAEFAFIGFGALDDASFRRMLLEHGLVNAIGFVGCGLVGFRLRTTDPRRSPAST